jgi:hypothetical protein
MRNEDIIDALEIAAGSRIPSGSDIRRRRTVSGGDVSITRRTILLFLENLDPEMTVAELREHLE